MSDYFTSRSKADWTEIEGYNVDVTIKMLSAFDDLFELDKGDTIAIQYFEAFRLKIVEILNVMYHTNDMTLDNLDPESLAEKAAKTIENFDSTLSRLSATIIHNGREELIVNDTMSPVVVIKRLHTILNSDYPENLVGKPLYGQDSYLSTAYRLTSFDDGNAKGSCYKVEFLEPKAFRELMKNHPRKDDGSPLSIRYIVPLAGAIFKQAYNSKNWKVHYYVGYTDNEGTMRVDWDSHIFAQGEDADSKFLLPTTLEVIAEKRPNEQIKLEDVWGVGYINTDQFDTEGKKLRWNIPNLFNYTPKELPEKPVGKSSKKQTKERLF